MIVTCGSCETKFRVNPEHLGVLGREVRCSRCKFQWFQESEDSLSISQEELEEADEAFEDEEIDLSDEEIDSASEDEILDDSVLEDSEEEEEPFDLANAIEDVRENIGEIESYDEELHQDEREETKKTSWRTTVSGILLMLVFAVSFGFIILLNKPIMNIWPESAVLYQKFGILPDIMGEGLIFDQIKATSKQDKDGVEKLFVQGKILNLKKTPVKIPVVKAFIKNDDGKVAKEWIVAISQSKVQAEGNVLFSTSYPQIDKKAKEVRLEFVVEQ
jgi:predicted Zn finger-like uncharacterized protein